MIFEKLAKVANKLENPKYPLLGPNIKVLYIFGLWFHGNKLYKFIFYCFHTFALIFVMSELIDLYEKRNNMIKVLENVSILGISIVAFSKIVSFMANLPTWTRIVNMISQEEISQIRRNDADTVRIMDEYKKYSRSIIYTYWFLVILSIVITIFTPALKFVAASDYRKAIINGTESPPFIFSSWFPFNENKMPGYLGATLFHLFGAIQGGGVVASFDANAVVMMSYLKGHAVILREKCKNLFGEKHPISKTDVIIRIRECHRLHNLFVEIYTMFNAVLSPVMFVYVLVCSITICCGVVQLTSDEVQMFQKLWVIEFVTAQCFQLLLYCWHSNEIALETDKLSRSVFESNYWRSDLQERKLILLLSGKMKMSYILEAGPFANLSVPTFLEILKGTYSFYTLFTQMQ